MTTLGEKILSQKKKPQKKNSKTITPTTTEPSTANMPKNVEKKAVKRKAFEEEVKSFFDDEAEEESDLEIQSESDSEEIDQEENTVSSSKPVPKSETVVPPEKKKKTDEDENQGDDEDDLNLEKEPTIPEIDNKKMLFLMNHFMANEFSELDQIFTKYGLVIGNSEFFSTREKKTLDETISFLNKKTFVQQHLFRFFKYLKNQHNNSNKILFDSDIHMGNVIYSYFQPKNATAEELMLITELFNKLKNKLISNVQNNMEQILKSGYYSIN